MIKLRFNITDGGIEGGQNFYLPQLIPSFFAPFFSHFRRTRITPTKLIRFCARQQLCHTARHNWQSIRGTIPHSLMDDYYWKAKGKWNDRRSWETRRFPVKYHSSILFTWFFFPIVVLEYLWWWREENRIYDFLEGRNLWYRVRKYRWFLSIRIDNLFHLYIVK